MPWLGVVAVEGGEAVLGAGAAVEGAEAVGAGAAAAAGSTTSAVGGTLSAAAQAARLQKVLQLARTLAAASAATCATCCKRLIIISKAMSPESVKHIDDAQAKGFPSILTYDPAGAKQRRARSTYGIATQPGMQRDEYPPAAFAENGGVADVRLIPSKDNESAGGQLSAGLKGATAGCIVTMKTGP